MGMEFFMIVNDPEIAQFVSKNGVSRLFVDLEYMGKDIRQKNLDTWKSRQTTKDVTRIRDAAPDAHLLVRINPMHDGTAKELDDVLARGADSVMLPMFRTLDELARFLDLLAGRAEALPLFETADALQALPEIVRSLPLTRLHIGLNDLHLDMGLDFMFQPIAQGLLEEPAAAMKEHGVAFGIGGIARSNEGAISPELLLGEHIRLGSDATILSRSLHRQAESLQDLRDTIDFAKELVTLQQIYSTFKAMSAVDLEKNKTLVADKINDIAHLIQQAKGPQQ